MRLRLLMEDACTLNEPNKQNLEVKQPSVPELPISTQLSAVGQSESVNLGALLSKGSNFVKSPESRRTMKSGIPVIDSKTHLVTKSVAVATMDQMTKNNKTGRESH